jgi:predicted P-loop ATPase
MLILEGEQGKLKSTACRILAGDEYFSDNLPDLKYHAKDASQHMRGKWIIEIPEMHAFDREDTERLKGFLSRREEQYRPVYGYADVKEGRYCLFVGTTNRDVYLSDPSGARRLWPVRVWMIDIEALIRDRDQLFAEAVYQYKEGVHWWPDEAFERDFMTPEQDLRFEADIWENKIRETLVGREETSLDELARVLGIDVMGRAKKEDQKRLVGVLKHLKQGWYPSRGTGGKHVWKREWRGPE